MTLRPPGMTSQEALFVEKAGLTRKALLRRAGGSLLVASAAGTLLAACGEDTGSGGAASGGGEKEASGKATGTVAMLTWQGYDDKEALAPLRKQGVKVAASYVGNNEEIVTKLRGGGVSRYDVSTPYHGYVGALVQAKLVQPIDYARLESAKTLFPEFAQPEWNTFEGKTYSAPLVWGDAPLVRRTDLLADAPESWLDLQDSKYRRKVVMWDDGYGHILVYAKALFGPDKPNELTRKELDEVMVALRGVKKNAVTVAPSHGDAADVLARGDAAIATASWAYVAELVKQKGRPAETSLPKEGGFAWADSHVIPAEAPNPDAAYAVLEASLSAEGNALVAGNLSSGTVNRESVPLLDAKQRELYPYDDLAGHFSDYGFYSIPPLEPQGDVMTLKDWNAAWEELKAA